MAIDHKKAREFGRLELLAKQAVEGFITGLHKSPFHGFSVEFAEHRLYNQGESTRHIDWKLYGRTEKLFVKRYEEETNLRCRLVFDTSSSMYYPTTGQSKLEFSVNAGAALMYLMRKQRDAVGITLFDDQISLHTPCKSSMTHHRFLFAQMEKYLNDYNNQERKGTSLIQNLHHIAEQTHKRSLVMIFSDMITNSEQEGDLFGALQHLRHNKHEVVIFNTKSSSTEIGFEFSNRPYTFVDMETGEEIKLNPSQLKEKIAKAGKEKQKELKLKCGSYKIDYVFADIDQDYHHVLLQYLIKRQKMI